MSRERGGGRGTRDAGPLGAVGAWGELEAAGLACAKAHCAVGPVNTLQILTYSAHSIKTRIYSLFFSLAKKAKFAEIENQRIWACQAVDFKGISISKIEQIHR